MFNLRSTLLICTAVFVFVDVSAGPKEDALRDLYTRIGVDAEVMICKIEEALLTHGSDSERLVCAGIPDCLLKDFNTIISEHSGHIELAIKRGDPQQDIFWETIFDTIYAVLLDIKGFASEKGLKVPRWGKA